MVWVTITTATNWFSGAGNASAKGKTTNEFLVAVENEIALESYVSTLNNLADNFPINGAITANAIYVGTTFKMFSGLLNNIAICDAITTKKVKAINGTGSHPEKPKIAFPALLFDLAAICVPIENKNGITIK